MNLTAAITPSHSLKPATRLGALILLAATVLLATGNTAFAQDSPDIPKLEPNNSICLSCHNITGFAMPGANGEMVQLHVSGERFGQSVHSNFACINCHEDITKMPHEKGVDRKVGCVQCHRDLWDKARLEGSTEENHRLGVVVDQVESYMGSIHARPSMADQGRTNATCYDCHDAHYISPINGDEPDRATRLATPQVCGQCHEDIEQT